MELEGKKIFFVGIGGIGMSGLAKILLSRGYEVSGSDITDENTKELEKLGAKIFVGHKGENIDDTDVVVATAAVNEENPEVKAAKEKGITVLRRSELLGILMSEKKGIAVTGTHGKTTTSTLLSIVLEDAGLDPAVSLGGEVKNIGGNAKDGKGEYFVAESCEFDRAFLDLHPYAAIITNIEEDHLDIYKDLADIIETFKKFISQIDKNGFLVYSADDKNTIEAVESFLGEKISYGIENEKAFWNGKDVKVDGFTTYFKAYKNNEFFADFELKVPGNHNILNALAVIAVADKLGVSPESIQDSLKEFQGALRRYEIKGEKDGVVVIDDYAHHPTEIVSTLKGVRSVFGKDRKVWAVFQPHQYSRTKYLLEEFSTSFSDADKVIIPEIYRARDTEEDVKSVSGKDLANEINKNEGTDKAIFITEFPDVVDYLKENAKEGDIVLTMGAGPVYKVGEEFLS